MGVQFNTEHSFFINFLLEYFIMTVYPKCYILPLVSKLKTLGVTVAPSKLNPDYYTIVGWDKYTYTNTRKVKLFLHSRFGLKPLSLVDENSIPVSTSTIV